MFSKSNDDNIISKEPDNRNAQMRCSSLKSGQTIADTRPGMQRRHTGVASRLDCLSSVLGLEIGNKNLRRGHGTYISESDGVASGPEIELETGLPFIWAWLEGVSPATSLIYRGQLGTCDTYSPDEKVQPVLRRARSHGSLTELSEQQDEQAQLQADLFRLNNDYKKLFSIYQAVRNGSKKILSGQSTELEDIKRIVAHQNDGAKFYQNIRHDLKHSSGQEQKLLENSISEVESEIRDRHLEAVKMKSQLEARDTYNLGAMSKRVADLEEEIKCKDLQVLELRQSVKELDEIIQTTKGDSKLMELQREVRKYRDSTCEKLAELETMRQSLARLSEDYRQARENYEKSSDLETRRVESLEFDLRSMKQATGDLERLVELERGANVECRAKIDDLSRINDGLRRDWWKLGEQHRQAMDNLPDCASDEYSRLEREIVGQRNEADSLASSSRVLADRIREAAQKFCSIESRSLDKIGRPVAVSSGEALNQRLAHLEASRAVGLSEQGRVQRELAKSRLELDELRGEISRLELSGQLETGQLSRRVSNRKSDMDNSIKALREELEARQDQRARLGLAIGATTNELDQLMEQTKLLRLDFHRRQLKLAKGSDRSAGQLRALWAKLKLEQHNRQVMRHEIERKVRLAIHELELLKCRRSSQLVECAATVHCGRERASK